MGERRVEVAVLGGWAPTCFDALQVGDKFIIFDDDVRYIDSCGNIEWTVEKAPVVGEDGILYVKTKESTQ